MSDLSLDDFPAEQKPSQIDLSEFPDSPDKIKTNFKSALQISPDEAARVDDLHKKTGLDHSFIAKNQNSVQAVAQTPSSDVLDSLAETHPKTARLWSDAVAVAKTRDDAGNLLAHEDAAQKFDQVNSYYKAVKAGLQGSVFGHIYDRGAPDTGVGPQTSFGQNLAASATGVAADFPFMAIGGAGATALAAPAGPAAVLAAGPGAFALPAFLKSSIAEYYRTGDMTGISAGLEKAFNVAKATGKQAVVGLITELTGGAVNRATVGAFLPTAEKMAGMTLKQTMTKMFAQNSAMTVSGAAVEGHAPSLTDLATNTIMMAGLEGVHHLGGSPFDKPIADAAAEHARTLHDLAQESQFRKRDPEGYAAHMNEIASGPVRIPVAEFEKAVDPRTAEHLGLIGSYDEAKRIGGDVEVPMGAYMSQVFDKPREALIDSVKFDEDARPLTQLKKAEEEQAAEQKAQASKDEESKGQGVLAGLVSQVKKMFGVKEEAAPEQKITEQPAKMTAPPSGMFSEKPEVAERELASRHEITKAQVELGQVPQQIEGVDPELAEQHAQMEADALKSAESILMKPQLEEMARDAEKERASLEAGARIEVENDPLYKADAELREALGPNAFTKFADGKLEDHEEAYFQAVAEKHGFTSADELTKKLIGAPTKEQAIKNLVEDMAPKPVRNTPEFRTLALRAIHNEKMGALLALRSEIYEGMKQGGEQDAEFRAGVRERARIAWEDAKGYAKNVIAGKTISTAGKFRPYYTAERDAAIRAYKASKAGKFDEAAKATREQLQAHALAAESLRARDNIERWTNSIAKIAKADPKSFRSQEHYDQAAWILHRFGLDGSTFGQLNLGDQSQPSPKSESLADWAKRMNDETGTVAIPIWLMNESVSKNFKDLTPQELHDVRDALKNIKQTAVNEDKSWTIREGEGLGALTEELHAAKAANVEGGKTKGAGTYESKWDKLIARKDAARQALVSVETLMGKLDGYERKGAWQDTFIESKARSEDARDARMRDLAVKWKDVHEGYSTKELSDMKSKPIWVPELNDNLTKDDLVTLAANQGTDGNQEKVRSALALRDGLRVPVDQLTVDSILHRELSQKDWQLVQKRIDFASSSRGDIGALYKKLTGFEPDWVDAKTIKTPFGELRGGYYPLIPDPRVTIRGFEEMKNDEALNNPPPTWKAATKNGFIEARNQYARYAVSLDGNGLVRHMSDVAHDLSMREWVLDMNRILGNKSVQADLVDALGMDQFQSIKNWVKQIAGNDVKPLRGTVDQISSALRRRATVADLGGKVAVMLSQLHGVTAAAGVDPENFRGRDIAAGLGEAYFKLLRDPKGFLEDQEWVDKQSDYMTQKSRNADRDLADASRKMFGENNRLVQVANYGFGLIDSLITKPIWRQAYRTGLRLEAGDHDAAVAYADRIIRNSTLSGRKSDLPEMMRSSEASALVTMFHGFVDRQFQLMYRAADQVEGAKDIPRLAGTGLAVMVLPNMIYALTHDVFAKGGDLKKKWEKAAFKSLSPLSLIPVMNTLQDMAIDAYLGKRISSTVTPVGGIVDAYQALLEKQASRKAKTQQKIEAAAHLASYAVPYPDQLNRWVFNIADYINGRMKFEPGDILQRRPSKQRHK